VGYFDAIASSSFKETKSGRMAFYPWGRFGKGYETQTEAQYQALKRFVIRYYVAMVPLGIAAGVFRLWIAIALLLPVSILIYVLAVRTLTRDLPRTDEKITMKDSYEAQARRHSPAVLWAMLIVSLLFVAGGVVLISGPGELLAGLLAIVFFGACAAVFAWMLLVRRRLLRQADPDKARVFN
jgi:hypothetical protein